MISDGLRRSLLLDDACADRHDSGMLVLDPDDGVDLANQVAEKWIDEPGTGTRAGTTLPLVIRAVARQARAIGGREKGQVGEASTRLARARVRTKAGRWVIVRASLLGEGTTAPVAVLLQAARPTEMAPLLADVYGLTAQERRVTECVAQGPADQTDRQPAPDQLTAPQATPDELRGVSATARLERPLMAPSSLSPAR